MIRNKTLLTIIAVLTSIQFAFCQADKNDLYLQTSEVNDIMVHYNADHGIIMRFYSTSGNRSEWWNNQYGDNYNSPERRQRLLRLTGDYMKQLEAMDFDKMNINGKVDYLLFKRDLEDEK